MNARAHPFVRRSHHHTSKWLGSYSSMWDVVLGHIPRDSQMHYFYGRFLSLVSHSTTILHLQLNSSLPSLHSQLGAILLESWCTVIIVTYMSKNLEHQGLKIHNIWKCFTLITSYLNFGDWGFQVKYNSHVSSTLSFTVAMKSCDSSPYTPFM